MRWIKKKYADKEIRTRTAFLFFPKTMLNINKQEETRWLEKASWYEEFLGYGESTGHEFWVNRRWFGDEE